MLTTKDEPNARLIAAAPKVLSCLEELSEWMRSHCNHKDGTHEMLVRAVETIIEAGGEIR